MREMVREGVDEKKWGGELMQKVKCDVVWKLECDEWEKEGREQMEEAWMK